MARQPSRRKRPESPEGWEYTQEGLTAWDDLVAKFESALHHIWVAKTTARDSKSLDGPDCRDAGRILLVGLPVSRWLRTIRIASNVGYIFAGILVKEAFTVTQPQQTNVQFWLWLIAAVSIFIATAIIQEMVLRK